VQQLSEIMLNIAMPTGAHAVSQFTSLPVLTVQARQKHSKFGPVNGPEGGGAALRVKHVEMTL